LKATDRVYVRFVCFQTVGSQRSRLGLFSALDDAVESDFAPGWAIKEARVLYDWFKANLAVPKQFSVGGHTGHGQPGLSWFKPAATEHIQQLHRLKGALEELGLPVEVLTTRDPGLVVWQDKHQVVAEPRGRKF